MNNPKLFCSSKLRRGHVWFS
uniref:Uncharacterized protein n=1 Tax=Arundo donax TaxID=35708 RepID=A0A0A9B7N3_ARUDO